MNPTRPIRAAVHGEIDALTALAHRSKRHWGYPEAWIVEWREALTVTAEQLADYTVRVVDDGGTPAGFYILIVDGTAAELEAMWVDPPSIGQGVGELLFRDAVAHADRQGARTLGILSDPNAVGFYERMGARPDGREYAPVAGVERYLPRLKLEIRSSTPNSTSR